MPLAFDERSFPWRGASVDGLLVWPFAWTSVTMGYGRWGFVSRDWRVVEFDGDELGVLSSDEDDDVDDDKDDEKDDEDDDSCSRSKDTIAAWAMSRTFCF